MFLAQTNELLSESAFAELEPGRILLNLALVLGLGQILAWHYQRYAPVLSNKRKFSRIFVFIAATTMLVISVVKTSLALSLGLVGALSIIRFRTPIKEPEELAYLFLAVGIGIGLGADQHVSTVILFAGILLYLALVGSKAAGGLPERILVHVSSQLESASHKGDEGGHGAQAGGAGDAGERALRELLREAESGADRVDLRRVDTRENAFDATLVLDLPNSEAVGALLGRLRAAFPGGSVSIVEGGSLD